MTVRFDRSSGQLMLTADSVDEWEIIGAIAKTPSAACQPDLTINGKQPYQIVLDLTGAVAGAKFVRELRNEF